MDFGLCLPNYGLRASRESLLEAALRRAARLGVECLVLYFGDLELGPLSEAMERFAGAIMTAAS